MEITSCSLLKLYNDGSPEVELPKLTTLLNLLSMNNFFSTCFHACYSFSLRMSVCNCLISFHLFYFFAMVPWIPFPALNALCRTQDKNMYVEWIGTWQMHTTFQAQKHKWTDHFGDISTDGIVKKQGMIVWKASS